MNADAQLAARAKSVELSVLVPTHNPDSIRLARTLAGLARQTFGASSWETVVVDNASSATVDISKIGVSLPGNLRVMREPRVGLTHARCRGFEEAQGPICVLVDDDNVLAPDYLENVAKLVARHPDVGAFGGRSVPEFTHEPEEWQREFFDLLALRDLGPDPIISQGLRPGGGTRNEYPRCAPIGAGMAVRRDLALGWCREHDPNLPDRQGTSLTSAGDNDLVFWILEQGASVAYFPELMLTHLIPAARLEIDYLGRLNRGIQRSWMQVLSKHDANPWPSIPNWTVPLRQAKAWWSHRAWGGPAARIRWQGACGHFEGRASSPLPSRK